MSLFSLPLQVASQTLPTLLIHSSHLADRFPQTVEHLKKCRSVAGDLDADPGEV